MFFHVVDLFIYFIVVAAAYVCDKLRTNIRTFIMQNIINYRVILMMKAIVNMHLIRLIPTCV